MRRVTRIDAGWLPAADWHEHLNIEYHRGQHTGLHTAPPPGRLSSSATSAELDTWTLDICRYMVIGRSHFLMLTGQVGIFRLFSDYSGI